MPGDPKTRYKEVMDMSDMTLTGADAGNTGHETLHAVNNRINNTYTFAPHRQALYVFDGEAYVINNPRVTLSMVASVVPNDLRSTQQYQTYLLDPTAKQYYENRTTFLFDELSAYCVGTCLYYELRSPQISFSFFAQCNVGCFCIYTSNISGNPRDLVEYLTFVHQWTTKMYNSDMIPKNNETTPAFNRFDHEFKEYIK